MKKKVISIDENLCIGCGNCVTSCAQGAIKIVDGKAKLVNENFCDGLGNCIGDCPTNALKIIEKEVEEKLMPCGCPSSMTIDRTKDKKHIKTNENLDNESELRQWPVQLHLVNPDASYFKNSELLVLSTCSPVASANIHKLIKDRAVVVACPKLDRTDGYLEKLASIFKLSNTPKVTVAIMEVPCCKGLLHILNESMKLSGRNNIKLEILTISLDGKFL
jgi:NAD-dependent dihydropyrimidine dehydrogenase PreA subunit